VSNPVYQPEVGTGPVLVPIRSLRLADSPRVAGEDMNHVRALAKFEGRLPPIVVHRPTMRVIDGMHRLSAALRRGQKEIEVSFVDGSEHDLFVLAVELNSGQGLPLSQRDRITAATRIVRTHPHRSDRSIARLVGLSAKTVAAIRRRSTDDIPRLNTRLGLDGKVRPLSAAHGRELAGRLMAERPAASLRVIAREAGVSLGTAQDVSRRLRAGQDPVPASGERSQPAVPAEPNPVSLQHLRNDPSLRSSDMGRALLRLLSLHSIPAQVWTQVAAAVPAHSAETIAALARGCAESWLDFASKVTRTQSP
jgi:ParB-like chromosome segregation protein Spo0J